MIRPVCLSFIRDASRVAPAVKRATRGVQWVSAICILVVAVAADTTVAPSAPAATQPDSSADSAGLADLPVDANDSANAADALPVVVNSTAADSSDTLLESILTAGEQPRSLAQDTATSTLARSGWRSIGQQVAELPPVRFVRVHALLLLLLAAGTAVIWLSLTYLTGAHEKQRFLTTTRLSIMDKEVQKACRHIERNYADPSLTPETLCRSLTTSEAFLSALFERELGMTVEGFIRQVRINRVKILLRTDPHTPLSELADKTGFGSADMLCEAFTDVSGISFEEYRDAVAANEEPETSLS